jgi:hypothetical protein
MTDRPRTFEECVAAQDPAERERWERAGCFVDPGCDGVIREVTVFEDDAGNGDWRVEYFDRAGAGYVTIFAGPEAERHARDYFHALKSGSIKIIRTGEIRH